MQSGEQGAERNGAARKGAEKKEKRELA